MPNKYRSTFEIELNGVEYTLRPSFEAICQFNDVTGMDVFDALQEIGEKKKLSIKLIVGCIWAGIKGEYEFQGDSRNCPNFSKIGEECKKAGFTSCLSNAIKFLTFAVASDEDIKKFEEAEGSQ